LPYQSPSFDNLEIKLGLGECQRRFHRGVEILVDTFEGKPDARQAQEHIKTSRFRPRYRQLTDEEKALHDQIKSKAEELETLFEKLPIKGRYHAMAITALEQAIMWIIKELTS
jgi:hypothetical protein